MKKIAILGLTGSIGKSAIEIIKHHQEHFRITFASANTDYENLYNLAKENNIEKIALVNNKPVHQDESIKIYYGKKELINLIKNEDYDILINAVSGSAGLPYSIETIKQGKDLALANKESLIMAGHLISDLVKETGSNILPIDSEHSAIFQVLYNRSISEVKKLHLTASGGPFRTLPLEDFSNIKLEQVLKHPVWNMGRKVTIDSATMMNKGLEVIEAHWLFNISYENISAVIHPQSIIHSIVEFIDGSMISQMSTPTMQLPILYALTHPKRINSNKIETNLETIPPLSFEPICKNRYPLYYLAREAAVTGGLMPTILNYANEKAIELFINGSIYFKSISEYVEEELNKTENINNPDLETILSYASKS